jgi:hypothetical protein
MLSVMAQNRTNIFELFSVIVVLAACVINKLFYQLCVHVVVVYLIISNSSSSTQPIGLIFLLIAFPPYFCTSSQMA